jgi:hypothetical protein
MGVLWIGHEADCYDIHSSSAVESSGARDASYERSGMRVGLFETTAYVQSTPDWAARDEIYHRFNERADTHNGAGLVLWAAADASGQIVAKMVTVGAGSNSQTVQFQVWNGATFDNVGAAFNRLASNTPYRYDVHFKGGADGAVEVWYGTAGGQTKVLDTSGSYASAVNIVRILHYSADNNAYQIGHEIVQTSSTLNATSESKQPTSAGADATGTGTYLDVDESSWNDADYISLSAAGQRNSFKGAARSQTQGVVTGVTASCRAWFEAGGPTQIKPYLTIGGTRYYGTTFAVGATPTGYQYTWTTNPATGAAFTTTEANAATLEWGWEAV